MATLVAPAGGAQPNAANLGTAQTGNGQSTNVIDRGAACDRAALLKIVSTVGATPTATVAIEGSADGTTWFNVPYALPATPETVTVANLTITTATTTLVILRPNHPWRFLRLTISANTNVTLTSDVSVF